MLLCFYRQDAENFKEKHKIIDVPFFPKPLANARGSVHKHIYESEPRALASGLGF
jgi:hypothetical protein